MPLLGILISTLFGGLVSFLLKFVSRKFAVSAASIIAMSGLYIALMVVFNTIVSPLAARIFTTGYGQALGLAFPPVAGDCLVALGAAWSACVAFNWNRENVRLATSA